MKLLTTLSVVLLLSSLASAFASAPMVESVRPVDPELRIQQLQQQIRDMDTKIIHQLQINAKYASSWAVRPGGMFRGEEANTGGIPRNVEGEQRLQQLQEAKQQLESELAALR
ncbi:uncharacterized protein BJ171DRAFT_499062, partial [Polychytrium aggregatum]|uniref:uncharacterized protein n=1 Tax=Polychytrium aggregatum TaxID=110093 RepID=UPI0022FDF5DA